MNQRNAIAIAVVSIALLALPGCADRSPAGAAPAAGAAAAATAPAAGPVEQSASSHTQEQGDCDLLTAADISTAFGGKLTVRRTSGRGPRGGGCTWSLAEVAESQIILQAGNEADYNARKDAYTGQRGITIEPLELGKDALMLNKAQVIVLREDGQSLGLALQLIAFDTPIPVTQDEAASGIETLAGIALSRL